MVTSRTTCYGCPVVPPTPANPTPPQNISIGGIRNRLPGNCSPAVRPPLSLSRFSSLTVCATSSSIPSATSVSAPPLPARSQTRLERSVRPPSPLVLASTDEYRRKLHARTEWRRISTHPRRSRKFQRDFDLRPSQVLSSLSRIWMGHLGGRIDCGGYHELVVSMRWTLQAYGLRRRYFFYFFSPLRRFVEVAFLCRGNNGLKFYGLFIGQRGARDLREGVGV
jgi:hypothetical protein